MEVTEEPKMKKLALCLTVIFCVLTLTSASVAQCDRNSQSPIRCGYYDEGYQDGARDAQANLGSNYQRYRSKFERQYESFYSDGYNAGYSSGSNPGGPGNPGRPGGSIGRVDWSGRVDNRVRVYVQGTRVWGEDMTNSGFQQGPVDIDGSLPRRPTTVSVNKQSGRGDVYVVEQPSRSNNFTAAVEISDPRGGADNYRLRINWTGSGGGGSDTYRSGRVNWRGRIDDRTNISISGNDVWTTVVSGQPPSNVDFNLDGYLASRSGTVRASKRNGRGSVQVIEQPSIANGFTAVIQVFDSGSGPDDYEIEMSW